MTTASRPYVRLMATMSLVIAATVLLTACNAGGGRKRDADGNLMPTARELDPAGTLYSDTVEEAEKGNCSPESISVLTCFAYRGHGYEGAMATLGQCFIHNGKAEDGVTWLARAANGGWPDAQKALARIYLEGKNAPQNKIEAGAWANLYTKNPSLLSLGVQPDMSVSQKMRDELTAEERSEARRRSDAWSPAYWQPSDKLDAETAATCRVRTKKLYKKKTIDLIPSPDDNF